MKPLVLQSDFGHADGAVSAMYGVAVGVCDALRVYDLTHDIPQYDIWEASYRLIQTVQLLAGRHGFRQRRRSGRRVAAPLRCGAHGFRPVYHHAR